MKFVRNLKGILLFASCLGFIANACAAATPTPADRALNGAISTLNVELAKIALKNGAKPNGPDFAKRSTSGVGEDSDATALEQAVGRGTFFPDERAKQRQIIGLLVAHGANVNYGLLAAVQKNDAALCEYFIRKGADPNQRLPIYDLYAKKSYTDFITPLIAFAQKSASAYAIEMRNPTNEYNRPKAENFVRVMNLLVNSSNVNLPDTAHGMTPLMYAAKSANPYLIKALLARGARKDVKDPQGHTAMDYALSYGNLLIPTAQTEILKLLNH